MFTDNARPHPSGIPTRPNPAPHFGMMLAELWHDWFEAMSEVAYQTHRACEFLAENGSAFERAIWTFRFRSLARSI